VVAFDRKDGTRKWWVQTQSTSTGTPVVSRDLVYVATWFPSGEPDLRVPLPDFATLLKGDKNADGALSADELPETMQLAQRNEVAVKGANLAFPAQVMIAILDQNKDDKVGKEEWEGFVANFMGDHGLLAIKPGGRGDVTLTHVLWREPRGVPEVPTPLVSPKRVFMVTNGGIVTCLNATTGKVLFRTRLGAGGAYYASPVMAGEHLYFASGDGVVTVIRDADEFTLAGRSDLAEPVFATPAIVEGHIYVRTATRLYAFRRAPSPSL
jgi:outer membrane protein assembly factor BamB